MIGMCRRCKRVLSHDEARCPYCDLERPVELPWEAGSRRPPRRWPRGQRRWMVVLVVSLVLVLALTLCSGG